MVANVNLPQQIKTKIHIARGALYKCSFIHPPMKALVVACSHCLFCLFFPATSVVIGWGEKGREDDSTPMSDWGLIHS